MNPPHRFEVLRGGRDGDADWREFCRLIGWQEGPEPAEGYEEELSVRVFGDEEVVPLRPPATVRRGRWWVVAAAAAVVVAGTALWRSWPSPATAVSPRPAPERAPVVVPATPPPLDEAPLPTEERDRPHGRRVEAPREPVSRDWAPREWAPRPRARTAPAIAAPPRAVAEPEAPTARRPEGPRLGHVDPDAPPTHASVPPAIPFELTLVPDQAPTLATRPDRGAPASPAWSHLGGAGEPHGRPVAVVDLREASRWLSAL